MGKSMYDFGKQMKEKARRQKQEDTKQYSSITIQNNRILNAQHIRSEKRA
jgi:hypothetical protein